MGSGHEHAGSTHHSGEQAVACTVFVRQDGAVRCARATLDGVRGVRYGSIMLDPKFIDDIARRLTGALPASAKAVQDDLEKNLRASMQSVFTKMDLVTREEFDVQSKVLARSRAKIDELEKQVAALEERLLEGDKKRSC
jgi:BMFP domain-containing protein YqiC